MGDESDRPSDQACKSSVAGDCEIALSSKTPDRPVADLSSIADVVHEGQGQPFCAWLMMKLQRSLASWSENSDDRVSATGCVYGEGRAKSVQKQG